MLGTDNARTAARTTKDYSTRSLRFSIIIPVRNAEGFIRQCLDALTQLDFTADLFHVVVVDNGSVDRTVPVAESFAGSLDIQVLKLPYATISALRNAGARASKGEILAFLDADCLPRPDWLSSAARIIDAYQEVILGCDYLIPRDSSWVARSWYGSEQLPEFARCSYVPAGDLFVPRAVFERIGGFNEGIQTNEDCEICLRARRAGVPVYSSATVAVVHLGTPQTPGIFFRKQHWHGTHVFRVFRQNLRVLQNGKPIAFAAYTLVASAAVLAGLVDAITRQKLGVLATGLAALLVAPVLLAARKALAQKKIEKVAPLSVLFLLYGLARALSMLNPKNW